MESSVKKMDGSRVSVTITVQPDEYKKFIDGALVRLNDAIEIKGFRKGKAPVEEIIKKVGEVGVYQEALQRIIPAFFTKVIEQEKLETVGAPEVNVDKLAPNNPLVFTVTTSLLPTIKLPDFTKIKVEEKEIVIEPKKVDEVLSTVQKMRAKEVITSAAADKNSKL
jgi:trigger factor